MLWAVVVPGGIVALPDQLYPLAHDVRLLPSANRYAHLSASRPRFERLWGRGIP